MKRAFSSFKVKCALDDCDDVISYENINFHETECLEKLIPCEYCGAEIKRLDLEEHKVSQRYSKRN